MGARRDARAQRAGPALLSLLGRLYERDVRAHGMEAALYDFEDPPASAPSGWL